MKTTTHINALHSFSGDFSLKYTVLFVKIAAAKSLTEVADALNVSTSSVSRGLTELEAEIGNSLINRDANHNRLTRAGEIFYPHAIRLFQYSHELVDAARSQHAEQGSVKPNMRCATNIALHLTLAQLHAFAAVAQAGGFGLAARLNSQKQSTLSYLVKNLEDSLGVNLLSRTPNGVHLTPQGESIVPIAESLLVAYAQAKNCMQLWCQNSNKKLMIAGSLSVLHPLMSVLVRKLKMAFPEMQIDVFNGQSDEVEQLVRQGRCIVGVCGVVSKKPEFTYTDLLLVPVGLIRSLQMSVPSVINSLDDLASVPLVRLSDDAAITQLMLLQHIRFPSYFDSPITVESGDAGLELVCSGSHAMVVTGIAASRFSTRNLTYLPLPSLLPLITVSMITMRDSPFDMRCQLISEIIGDCVLRTPWHESIKLLRKSDSNFGN